MKINYKIIALLFNTCCPLNSKFDCNFVRYCDSDAFFDMLLLLMTLGTSEDQSAFNEHRKCKSTSLL